MLTCFGMIWNYDKFSRWNIESEQNLCTFKNSYFSKFDCKKTHDILGTINTIYKTFQNISLENSSLRKHVFLGKRTIILNAN